MKLYEIDQEIEKCFDDETGEVLDEKRLDALTMERDKKIENVVLYIKDLRADADALKKEEQTLAQRRKTAENKAESLKNWLFMALEGNKFKTPRCAVSYRHSRAVEVPDIMKLAPDFIDYTPKPKKKDIKHMLENGFPVEGAQLVDRLSVIIK